MRIGNKEMSIKALDKLNSMRGMKSALENKQIVFLMHHLDGILAVTEDIANLEKIFGDRAMIYPHGGHLWAIFGLRRTRNTCRTCLNPFYRDRHNQILSAFELSVGNG
jgi:hypothetical protein